VRLDREVVRKARMTAAALDMTLPDYLASRLRAVVEKDLADVLAGMKHKKGKAE
jgi:hypothetical protein